jgi:hypothetical protein
MIYHYKLLVLSEIKTHFIILKWEAYIEKKYILIAVISIFMTYS